MKKIAVGITGASGAIYAKVLLDTLSTLPDVEVGVVMSEQAGEVWQYELGNTEYLNYGFTRYALNNFHAPFASGSSSYEGLIVCPCSMGTLGRIAHGMSDSLLTRTADVMLKERRKLVLVAREAPYNLIHINNMKAITEAGGIICPATPSFYSRPATFEALAATVVHRALHLAGISVPSYRWNEPAAE
jgi:4-hydroxy-3-polyprenylbenzoate decarboxylase